MGQFLRIPPSFTPTHWSSRWTFESQILTLTTVFLALKTSPLTFELFYMYSDTVILAFVAALAIALEATLHDRGDSWHTFKTKLADTQGLAVGLLALPWLFFRLIPLDVDTGFYRVAFLASCGFSHSVITMWRSIIFPQAGDGLDWHDGQPRAQKRPWLRLSLVTIAFALTRNQAYGSSQGPAERMVRFGGCGIVVLLFVWGISLVEIVLSMLPQCFTVGEAIVVTQALTLLALDSLQICVSLFMLGDFRSYFGANGLDFDSTTTIPTSLGDRYVAKIFTELLIMGMLIFAGVFCWVARLKGPTFSSDQNGHPPGTKNSPSSNPQAHEGQGMKPIKPGACEGQETKKIESEAHQGQGVEKVQPESRQGQGIVKTDRSHSGKDMGITVNLSKGNSLRNWKIFTLGSLSLFTALVLSKPTVWVLKYASNDIGRISMLLYWASILIVGIPVMDWCSRQTNFQNILIRKGYHILALALFAPALILQPMLLTISLAVASALLITLEALRISEVPIIAPQIHSFMTSFIDERDSGLILVSHFSLLVGMSGPVWLLASPNPQEHQEKLGPAFAGIVILGIADSAASALGRRFGRHKILGTNKSVEGTLGGIVCNILAWCVLKWFCPSVNLLSVVFASIMSCFLEASTTQLDNIFLPVHHLACLL